MKKFSSRSPAKRGNATLVLFILVFLLRLSNVRFAEGSTSHFTDRSLRRVASCLEFPITQNSDQNERSLDLKGQNWSQRIDAESQSKDEPGALIVKGMWLVSPQDVSQISLEKKKINGTIHSLMRRTFLSDDPAPEGEKRDKKIIPLEVSSSSVLHVPQYSTPVIAFNVEGKFPPNTFVCVIRCTPDVYPNDTLQSSFFNFLCGENGNGSIPVSYVSLKSTTGDLNDEEIEQLPFFQLPQEYTSLTSREGSSSEEKYSDLHVCLSVEGSVSSCTLLPGLRIVVDQEDFFYPNPRNDRTIHIPYNASGPLPLLCGFNVTYWSHSAMQRARFAISTTIDSSCEVRFPGTFSFLPLSMRRTAVGEAMWFIPPSTLESLRPTQSISNNNRVSSAYRVCISPTFSADYFVPTAMLLQVEPLLIESIQDVEAKGEIAVVNVAVPSVSPALFQISARGFSASTTLFLSEQRCHESMVRESLLNLTFSRPPPSYSATPSVNLSVIWPTLSHTRAEGIFSSLSERFLCLHGFSQRLTINSTVSGTFFKFRPHYWKIFTVKNLPDEVTHIQAMGVRSDDYSVDAIPVLVYGMPITLSVTGVGLKGVEIMAALNCSNSATFLWNEPIPLEPCEGLSIGAGDTANECSTHPLFCNETRYFYLSSFQTSQFATSLGLSRLSENSGLDIEWCGRLSSAMEASSGAAGSMPKVSSWFQTGRTARIIVPGFTGVRVSKEMILSHEVRLKSDSVSGSLLRFVGSVINLAHSDIDSLWASSLQVKLVPEGEMCNSEITNESVPLWIAPDGESVVYVSQLSTKVAYQLCYGLRQSTKVSPLPFFAVPGTAIRIMVEPLIPIVVALNDTETFSLPRPLRTTNSESLPLLVSVTGSGFSQEDVIQLIPPYYSCLSLQDSPVARSSGIPVFRRCRRRPLPPSSKPLMGSSSNSCEDEAGGEADFYYEAMIEDAYLSQLPTEATWFKVCSQRSIGAPWLPSPVTVILNAPSLTQEPPMRVLEYWSEEEIESLSLTIEAGAARIASALNAITQIAMKDVAAFSLWCKQSVRTFDSPNQVELCRTGLRVKFIPGSCVAAMNLSCYNASYNGLIDDYKMGPFTIIDGLLVVRKPPVQVIEWWALVVEVGLNRWERALEGVFFFSSTSQLYSGFSLLPVQVPPPFNNTLVLRTLVLHRSTTSVAYLSGFGVQLGMKMRFGTHCEENLPDTHELVHGINVSDFIRRRQRISNTALYTNPITVMDSFGGFFVPSSHISFLEQSASMCLSFDGGKNFFRTFLSLSVEDKEECIECCAGCPERQMRSIYSSFNNSIFILEDTWGNIPLEDVAEAGLRNWEGFGPGARIAAFPSLTHCHDDIWYRVEESAIVWEWPHSTLTISSSLTYVEEESSLAGMKKLHLCAMSSFFVLPLKVVIFILPVNIFVVSETPYLVDRNAASSMLPLTFKSKSASSCNESNRFLLECRMSTPSFWNGINSLRVRLSNRTSSISAEEATCDTIDGQSAVSQSFVPVLLSETYLPMTSSSNATKITSFGVSVSPNDIPSASLFSSINATPGIVCISVDGGKHYINTRIPYYTGSVSSTLLLCGSSHTGSHNTTFVSPAMFSTPLPLSAISTYFEGRLIDSRCVGEEYASVLCSVLSSKLWSGFLGSFGWAEEGHWFISLPLLPAIQKQDSLTFEPANSYTFTHKDTVGSGAVLSFQFPELRCATSFHLSTIYLSQQDSGAITAVPSECYFGLSSSTIIRLAPSKKEEMWEKINSTSRCLSASPFALEVPVEAPLHPWATGNDFIGVIGLVWPTLRNVPDGTYFVCVGDENAEGVYTLASLTVVIRTNPLSLQIAMPTPFNEVVVFQGANTQLRFTGQAVGEGKNVLVGFAPGVPSTVVLSNGTRWSWEHGCIDLSEVWAPTNSNTSSATSTAGVPQSRLDPLQPVLSDIILTTPITAIRAGGWLDIPADSVRFSSSDHLYFICVSLNGGKFFEPVAGDIKIRVMPPTIHSVIVSDMNNSSLSQPFLTTSNVLHAQRIPLRAGNSTVQVSTPSGSLPFIPMRLMTHTPLFYFSSVVGFSGSGFGMNSGREMNFSLFSDSFPISVASVAILRSSVVGSSCHGLSISNDSLLALPIFLLDLLTERFWNPDEERWQSNMKNEKSLEANPVLLHEEWIENTRYLRENGGVSITQMLQFLHSHPYDNELDVIDDVFFLSRESLIVCLSLDGEHYYSSNTQRGHSFAVQGGTAEEGSSLQTIDLPPLFLIPEETTSGSTYARDLSTLVTLVALNGSCPAFNPYFSVPYLQEVIAQRADVDKNVVVVQLQRAGCTQKLARSTEFDSVAVVVLSISVTANSGQPTEYAIPKLSSSILLNISDSFRQPMMLRSLFGSKFKHLEFRAVQINFFYSDGRSIEEISNFSSLQEEAWCNLFRKIPKDLGATEVDSVDIVWQEAASSGGSWNSLLSLLLVPIIMILGTIIVYRKCLSG